MYCVLEVLCIDVLTKACTHLMSLCMDLVCVKAWFEHVVSICRGILQAVQCCVQSVVLLGVTADSQLMLHHLLCHHLTASHASSPFQMEGHSAILICIHMKTCPVTIWKPVVFVEGF